VQQDAGISYAALQERIDRLAARLVRDGLRPGDRAAVLLDSSIDYVVACFGCMAAGAIVVPLNAAARARDIAAWLAHAGARWLLTRSDHSPFRELALQLSGIATILMEDEPAVAAGPVVGSSVHLAADMPACILYTSGTTSAPKGVLLSHGNLSSNARAIIDYLQLSQADSIACVLPFHYSYGTSVLNTHLLAGATLIIEPNLVYPHRVVETVSRQRVTGFAGVPSTFSLLLSRVALDQFDLSALRYVTQAGGAMSTAVAERLHRALPGTKLFIMYGQTEATARITFLPAEDLARKPGSVGIPIERTRVQIRSEAGEICQSGAAGDVWVQGPGVMLGYWRDDKATAAILQDGWLNTRDVGYLDAEGYLFLQGRRSDIIKVGAHRVSPQDVEEVIAELHEVAEVAAVGVEDELLGQAIKVSIVAVAGFEIDPLRIRAHCLAQLASYKVPKYVEVVGSLPKTASGKIRRHEL
jgi:acyl-CoA synthetase (AMP-forming)/AMP-acid ligase II